MVQYVTDAMAMFMYVHVYLYTVYMYMYIQDIQCVLINYN